MTDINWKFLATIHKNTILGRGSVIPQSLFVDLANQGLLEGSSQSARTTEKTRLALIADAQATRKAKSTQKKTVH